MKMEASMENPAWIRSSLGPAARVGLSVERYLRLDTGSGEEEPTEVPS